jgi:hypothetical protein
MGVKDWAGVGRGPVLPLSNAAESRWQMPNMPSAPLRARPDADRPSSCPSVSGNVAMCSDGTGRGRRPPRGLRWHADPGGSRSLRRTGRTHPARRNGRTRCGLSLPRRDRLGSTTRAGVPAAWAAARLRRARARSRVTIPGWQRPALELPAGESVTAGPRRLLSFEALLGRQCFQTGR